jgi:hypothetical protein
MARRDVSGFSPAVGIPQFRDAHGCGTRREKCLGRLILSPVWHDERSGEAHGPPPDLPEAFKSTSGRVQRAVMRETTLAASAVHHPL